MVSDTTLTDYLLGRMPLKEAADLQAQILADGALFDRARSLENELFDRFARRELDPETRLAFMKRYAGRTKRLQFAFR